MTNIKHIEHPEDTILTGDLDVLGWFQSPGRLSVKIDFPCNRLGSLPCYVV